MNTFLRGLVVSALLAGATVVRAGPMANLDRLVHDGYGRKARRLIRPLLHDKPADAHLVKLYAKALLIDQRFRKAFVYSKKLVRERPRDASDWLIYVAALVGKSARSGAFSLMGNAGRIHRVLENAVRLDPKDMTARIGLMQYDLQAPGFLGGSTRQAKVELRAINAQDPARGKVARAVFLWSKGHRQAAIAVLRRLIAEKPSLKGAKKMLAQDELELAVRDRRKKRRRKTAASAFQAAWTLYQAKAVRGRPRRLVAFYRVGLIAALADVHRRAGVRALEYYLTVVPPDQDPPAAWAHYRLGLLWSDLGHPRRARAQYEDALSEAHQRKLQSRKRLIHGVKRALRRLPAEPAPPPHG